MMTFLTQIPPALLVALLGLGWLAVASTRWRLSLLLDLAFIGLFAWRPNLGTLALVGAQAAVRYIPELARELALVVKVAEFDGWTMRLILVLLPGIGAYVQEGAEVVRAATPQPPQGAAPQPTIIDMTAAPDDVPPLPMNAWLATLNNDETCPHLGIVGPTRQGKTTFAVVVVYHRDGQLIVTTPKAPSTDPWGGAAVVRVRADVARQAVDWSAIEAAIIGVHTEMLRRNAEDTIGEDDQLTLVIDEFTSTMAALPHLRKKIIDLWLLGASAKVRVIVISPDVNVRAWNIEGRRDVIDNLIFARVSAGRRWELGRIDPNGRLIAPAGMDTRLVLGLARRVSLAGRVWSGSAVAVGVVSSKTPPAQTQTADRRHIRTAPDSLYDTALRAGLTRQEAAEHFRGLGYGFDNNRLRDRRDALGLSREQTAAD